MKLSRKRKTDLNETVEFVFAHQIEIHAARPLFRLQKPDSVASLFCLYTSKFEKRFL